MTKTQYWILNTLGVILAALLLTHYFFARSNYQLAEDTRQGQATIASSHQLEVTLDQMAKRVALGSETDPRLRQILIRYGLNVTLEKDGQKKTYP